MTKAIDKNEVKAQLDGTLAAMPCLGLDYSVTEYQGQWMLMRNNLGDMTIVYATRQPSIMLAYLHGMAQAIYALRSTRDGASNE